MYAFIKSEDANLIVGRNGHRLSTICIGKNLMIAHLNEVTIVFKEMQQDGSDCTVRGFLLY